MEAGVHGCRETMMFSASATSTMTNLGRCATSLDHSLCWTEDGQLLPMDDQESFCDHVSITVASMNTVSRILRDLFVQSYRNAVRSLYRSYTEQMQDTVLRKIIITYLEHHKGVHIGDYVRDRSTRRMIHKDLVSVCEGSFSNSVLYIATEDVYDLVCGLAQSHGHPLALRGPPCACSLTECIGCLHSLTKAVRQMHPSRCSQDVKTGRLAAEMADEVLKRRKKELLPEIGGSTLSKEGRMGVIADVLDLIRETYREVCSELNPFQLSTIKKSIHRIKSTDGIILWYAVAARELKLLPMVSKGKRKQNQHPALSFTCAVKELCLEKFQLKVGGDRMLKWAYAREAVADVCRERGNSAYSSGRYAEAIEYYTHAIAFNKNEVLFPLNRSACYIKVSKFKEAEEDCSTAINLDCRNHKAWFRRGVSRAGLGKLTEAKQDFELVLSMFSNDAKSFEEFRQMAEKCLSNAVKTRPGLVDPTFVKLPSPEGISPVPAKKTLVTSCALKSKRPAPFPKKDKDSDTYAVKLIALSEIYGSIGIEVFEQVFFTTAFCQILRSKTGVEVRVPFIGWNRRAIRSSKYLKPSKSPIY